MPHLRIPLPSLAIPPSSTHPFLCFNKRAVADYSIARGTLRIICSSLGRGKLSAQNATSELCDMYTTFKLHRVRPIAIAMVSSTLVLLLQSVPGGILASVYCLAIMRCTRAEQKEAYSLLLFRRQSSFESGNSRPHQSRWSFQARDSFEGRSVLSSGEYCVCYLTWLSISLVHVSAIVDDRLERLWLPAVHKVCVDSILESAFLPYSDPPLTRRHWQGPKSLCRGR